jgi:hypothetical protein
LKEQCEWSQARGQNQASRDLKSVKVDKVDVNTSQIDEVLEVISEPVIVQRK